MMELLLTILEQLVAVFTVVDRVKGWFGIKPKNPPDSIAARFVRLFETHGVTRYQIPRFFGHNLTLQDVQDDASLMSKLDDRILDAACARFAVLREWMDGAQAQIHPFHRFYKSPKEFVQFISSLKAQTSEGELDGVVIAPIDKDRGAQALLILQEAIGWVGEKPIYRYHLCDEWAFTYWRSRAYLTACIAIAWKRQVYVRGTFAKNKEIEQLATGETLLGWNGEGPLSVGERRWYPEDMALYPAAFLQDLDPEKANYGTLAGLQLWMELEREGLMDAGLRDDTRPLFENELASRVAAA